MPALADRPRPSSLFELLAALLVLGTASRSRTSKKSSRWQKEIRLLSSENTRDVREFQKRLHAADLGFAKRLLKLFETIEESKFGSDDPMKIEERRIELETIERGEHQVGRGWTWNGHFVPVVPSTAPYFERRKRIIRNGVWNPSRKGWENQGEFFGVWEH
jgi:hypothetical protein